MVNAIKDNGGGPRLAELAYAVLRIALNKAFNEEILHRLPFKSVALPKKHKKDFSPLTKEQWARLFYEAEADPEMYTALAH